MGILTVTGQAGGEGEVGEDRKFLPWAVCARTQAEASPPPPLVPALQPALEPRVGALGSVCWAGFLTGF